MDARDKAERCGKKSNQGTMHLDLVEFAKMNTEEDLVLEVGLRLFLLVLEYRIN